MRLQAPSNVFVVITLIGLAALSRLLPHPPNFTAVGAMALFGAAYLSPRWLGFAVPFAALWMSDLIINNVVYATYFDQFVWFYNPSNYIGFGLVMVAGTLLLRRIRLSNLVLASFSASLIFFVVSNFAVWLSNPLYPKTGEGLVACYMAGVPFFWNTLAGDLSFSLLLFGSFAWISRTRTVAA